MSEFMPLVVAGTTYFMRRVRDECGKRFVCEDITAVIDPRSGIRIEYDGEITHLTEKDVHISNDGAGNEFMSIALPSRSGKPVLYLRGIFEIDDAFLKIMSNTPLFSLVDKRRGCLAVSTFEVLDDFSG